MTINEYGIDLSLNSGIDASTYTAAILYKKPSGLLGRWAATVAGEGSSSVVYSIEEGDIDEAGEWKFRIELTKAGVLLYGSLASLSVAPVVVA